MSGDCNTIQKVLLRSGTDQFDRNKTVLNPDTVELHGFGISEWMEFAYNFAQHVNYFDISNHLVPDGDWQAFFKTEEETIQLLKELDESDELTPHLTLFICFLKLLELSSERMNKLTRRHLDYYYEEILQIDRVPAQEDKVHVLFELSKNILQASFDQSTQLNGEKDDLGKLRKYQLPEEFAANQAKINAIRNVYFDHDTLDPISGISQQNYYLKAAEVANSLDGLGAPLTEETPSWYAFGYNHNRVDQSYAELADAKLGFSVASHVLSLSEGDRHVQFDVQFAQSMDVINFDQLNNSIDVYYTGEKDWIGPLKLIEDSIGVLTSSPFGTELNVTSKKLSLYVNIGLGQEKTVDYDSEIHKGAYDTSDPMFKFVLKPANANGLLTYKNLIKKISSIKIKVEVQKLRNLTLESDTGTLNTKKPMFPFTNTPVKGSSLSIYHEEIFSKKWDKIKVDIKWKNTPDNFPVWYNKYKTSFISGISKSAYNVSYPQLTVGNIVTNSNYFKGTSLIKHNDKWQTIQTNINLFGSKYESPPFRATFTINGFGYNSGIVEAIRLSTNQSFLHEMYPTLYAVAISNSGSNSIILPNQPYTPLTEDVSVTYTAQDFISCNDTSKSAYEEQSIQFFHDHPFGHSEESGYLKSQLEFITNTSCTLAPIYCRGGEMYIALENADHLQTVSLLIQVLEGTENTLIGSFEGEQKVHWDILCSNEWKTLDSTLLRQNEVDNLLQSGIVAFKIPKEATSTNTRLGTDVFWVRAKMHKPFDAVCKVLGIHAQATLSEFVDNSNDLAHLNTGLASGTISKLIQRSSKVKSLTQPYNSFGGKPEESQENYYRRVSERLRHKHRSVMLWDYEHMVLEQFPGIYNVKCLNHTNDISFTAPGHVTLVVIPDTVDKNVFDIYQPRVSKAFLNRIQKHISQYTSLHVKLDVINPDYQPIQIDLKVKFHDQFDEALYSIQLNEDIIKLLSPWAFDKSSFVEFGETLHRSVLIDYIEELHYVDYIQDVQMITSQGISIQNYSPSSPKTIMVSAKEHKISTDIKTCLSPTKIITEECQQ
ncbi:MAG: baseplate J/gp47 family protein [Crocinitomicaceae bacterium]|nr:baseplate J/gp47 family protein [Crocinitomicaceae bacterium]